MPYSSNNDLPASVGGKLASEKAKTMFRRVVNAQLKAGKSESVAFASAWAALKNAGYKRNEDGMWVKKSSPTSSSVHVPSTEWEKAEYQGRKVPINKPFRLPKGSSKKFGVYVKDGGKVKRVTFGDPNMEIRRDDPDARANFRSRHSCDTATDKTSARYWSCRMWDANASVGDMLKTERELYLTKAEFMEIAKRQVNDDCFTNAYEAVARSVDLGLGGRVHVHSSTDGQAIFMPGSTHDEYLAHIYQQVPAFLDDEVEGDMYEDEMEPEPASRDRFREAIMAIIETVMKRIEIVAEFQKYDQERRIAWGWASVSTVDGNPLYDLHGDYISTDEMVKMADDFMVSTRDGLEMHKGNPIGYVLHSMPVTKELAESIGMSTKTEGWLVGMKIVDDKIWEDVKTGKYRAFSIGGLGKRIKED